MRFHTFLAAPAAAAALLALSSCLYSPTGINRSTELYPIPDESGQVTVAYVPPASKDAAEVTFLLELGEPESEEAASAPSKVDDSPDDGFTATFDASNLDPGVYFVSVFVGDEETPSGRVAFAKLDPQLLQEAAGDAPAEEATGEEAAAEE